MTIALQFKLQRFLVPLTNTNKGVRNCSHASSLTRQSNRPAQDTYLYVVLIPAHSSLLQPKFEFCTTLGGSGPE